MTTELITATIPECLRRLVAEFGDSDPDRDDNPEPEFWEAHAAAAGGVALSMSSGAWQVILDEIVYHSAKSPYDLPKLAAEKSRERAAVKKLAITLGL